MVRGIDKFKEYFSGYTGQYVLIGGTACDIILGRAGIDFRATKDFDLVLMIEMLEDDFMNRFIAFVEDGGYQHINKGTGANQFYRFQMPADASFPSMIELFSKRPDYLRRVDTRLAPIHVSDDVVSLSAIFLDDDYYELLKCGAVDVDGVSVLDIEYLILFKIKAWLDLTARKKRGEAVDSRNIKKHKNDVLRLTVSLDPQKKLTLHGKVKDDAADFWQKAASEPIDLRTLQIRGVSFEDLLSRVKACYQL